MAHGGSNRGQPATPQSIHDDPSVGEYTPSPVPAHPYTPPRSHRAQTYSYGDPEEYEMTHAQDYYEPTYYRTPPMPISSVGMQIRSGRSVGSPMTPADSSPGSRMSRSPRPKKRKGKKQEEELVIHEPLSVMTKDYDVPVMDMLAWANRPSEERYKAVEGKHKGKIPRPMNSFMLYRTAYKERIKKWGAQGDNNQLISKVAGSSWLLEADELKEFYTKCANTERDNHAAAFPNYKFAPNKNTKKRARDDEDESDPEWEGSSVYSGKRRRGRNDRDMTRSRSTTPAQLGQYQQTSFHPSSYLASNQDPRTMQHMQAMGYYDQFGRPVMPHSQYYHMSATTYPSHPQGLQYAPDSVPIHQNQYANPLVGLPPTANDGLNAQYSAGHQEFAIDPDLGDFIQPTEYRYGSLSEGQHHESQGGHEAAYEGEPEAVVHPSMQMLVPAESMWSPGGMRNEFDAELDRWHEGP